jgi:hypothetical protein
MKGTAVHLIVVTDEPVVAFFSSIKAAEEYLEWQDVETGNYPIAYDRDGNIYRLTHDGRRVFVKPDEGAAPDPAALNALLCEAIEAHYMPIKSEDNEFLLSLCTKYLDY